VLLLVRHGESAANAGGRLLGRAESPLTPTGRAQVERLGAALRGRRVARVLSSPLGRAQETARGLELGPVEVDGRWIEVDYGAYEGEPLGAVPAEVWARWRADTGFRPPGGESLDELGARVRGACEELFSSAHDGARADEDVVVVSHVSPIKAAVAWALGTGDDLAWRLQLSTGSLTRVGWGHGGPVLVGYNEVPST
jgi:probable phosphoglycerate mutase